MIRNKIRIIISLVIALYAILWLGISYYVIPRIVLPKAQAYLTGISKGPLTFGLSKIRFNPFRGFLIDGISIKYNAQGKEEELFSAGFVDIDLAFFPLFRRQIEVKHFKMYDVRANIYRNGLGQWNCAFLWGSAPETKKNGEAFSFRIKEFRVIRGRLEYSDYFKSDNSIRHVVENIEGEIRLVSPSSYWLKFSAGKYNTGDETVSLKAVYDLSLRRIQGDIQAYTNRLNDYWDYYLDEIMKPWFLHARSLGLAAKFNYENDRFKVTSEYQFNSGQLVYGDLTLVGDALVSQKSEFKNNAFSFRDTQLQIAFEKGAAFSGQYKFITDAAADVFIDNHGILIKDVSGIISGLPFRLKGEYRSQDPKELSLTGSVSGLDADLSWKSIGDKMAAIDYHSKNSDSYFNLKIDIQDTLDHRGALSVDSNMYLGYLKSLPIITVLKAKGRLALSGNISGEADKSETWQGSLLVRADNLSLAGIDPVNFSTTVILKDGEFAGDIPEIPLYKGIIQGKLRSNLVKWGAELNIDKLDLENIFDKFQQFKGIKGVISGNAAFVSDWKDVRPKGGGGYFKLKDCDFKGMPLFSQTQKSLQAVLKNFLMPVFTGIEITCGFKDKGVNIDALCSAPTLTLGLTGVYLWSGKCDFTIGTKILGKNIIKLARQIFFPFTIGFDLLTQAPQVKITGIAPDIKTKVSIQSMAWMDELLGLKNRILPYRYTLKELW